MSEIENYCLLFVDTFYSNFLLSTKDGFAFSAMHYFGADAFLLWGVALSAVFTALILNYGFGVFVARVFEVDISHQRYHNCQKFWQSYYLLIFGLVVMPIAAKFIMLFCGFLRFKLLRSLLLGLLMKAFYYKFYLYG